MKDEQPRQRMGILPGLVCQNPAVIPYRSLFGNVRPDYYAEVTDAHIVYPWEINRGPESVLLKEF